MTDLAQELIVGSESTADTEQNTSSKETTPKETTDAFLDLRPLENLSNGKAVRIPKNPHFTRKDVVNAFQQSFELMGGIPRLALWGHENPDKFYPLYARLLPSQASSALGESNKMVIEMKVPNSPLDE